MDKYIIELTQDCEVACRDADKSFSIVRLEKGNRYKIYSNDAVMVYVTQPTETGPAFLFGIQYLIPVEFCKKVYE